MPDVVVAIPTFRRPNSLSRLLVALADIDTTARVHVLVADNDAERHEGHDVCVQLAPTYRWPIEAILVPERGIAQVRNALVEHVLAASDAGFIAMLDDDEWPSRQWLARLLRVQRETGADLVQGSILFARGDDRSAARYDGVADIRGRTGPVAMVQGAGNLLVRRSCFDGLAKPYFDPAFALSGGEDRDFFVSLARAGKRFAWADEAIAHGEVAAQRLHWQWALARAYNIGNADMRVQMKHWPGWRRMAREWLKIAGAVLLSPVLFVVLAPSARYRLEAPRRLFRAAGKVAAMFGRRSDGYSVTHGN